MSLFSRLFGQPAPATVASSAAEHGVSAEPKQRADPAALAREEETSLTQAIAAGDALAVGKWVLEGSSTTIRQRAAQRIEDPEQLRELIRATRHGNDKTVHRILTARRDALLAESRNAQRRKAEVEETVAAIAQHRVQPYDATYGARLALLEAKWRTVRADAPTEVQSEVERQLELAHAGFERHRLALETEAQQQRFATRSAEEARRQRELEAQAAAATATERARALEAERQAELAQRQAHEELTRQLVGLLRQALAALDHGGTARATRLRATIAERMPQAPPLPAWFTRRLEQLDARLAELMDWKTFTVVPKRGELLQQMQSLAGAELSPEELAQRIRRLRDEWRTLRRGAGEEPGEEQTQFEEAARRAYEPCREHFARQAELRRENQARREALLERLAAVAAEQSGEQLEWRAIQQAIFEARREWQDCAPVDPAVFKPQQARFHAHLRELQARLDGEFARNADAKRALIARAVGLLELADTRQAIDEAKQLQRSWQATGPVPRNQDNALWRDFRRHCDAVFERSALQAAARGAALEASEARAMSLCEDLERIATLGGEALLSGRRQLEALRSEFESLELPRASARGLRQRFSQATERCEDALRRQRAVAARQCWSQLFAADAGMRAYALAVARERSPVECAVLRATAADAIAALTQTPSAARGLLEDRLAKVAAGEVDADVAVNETALRRLCVRAELIAGMATPPEDQPLRREYQMQRLVASMARGERATPADLDALALEWLAVGPVEPDLHELLLARFELCRAASGADPPPTGN